MEFNFIDAEKVVGVDFKDKSLLETALLIVLSKREQTLTQTS